MPQSPNTNLHAFNLAVRTLVSHPSHLLPHLTIPTFAHLPEVIGPHLHYSCSSSTSPRSPAAATTTTTSDSKQPPVSETKPKRIPEIKALVLDKDNTLSPPKTTHLPTPILTKLHHLTNSPTSPFNHTRNPNSILIVSNRAGSHPKYNSEITSLESQLRSHNLSVPIFRLPPDSTKKPFCEKEVVEWFVERGVVKEASEIAVVGDRIGTDGLLARRMGSWCVWTRDGVWGDEVLDLSAREVDRRRGVLEKMEVFVEGFLRERCGLRPVGPRGWE